MGCVSGTRLARIYETFGDVTNEQELYLMQKIFIKNRKKEKLAVLRERVKCVHIDIEDGVFVPNQTWPFASGGFEDADFERILNELILKPRH